MRGGTRIRGLISCVLTLAAAIVLYYSMYRPWALTWGATEEEVRRAMPGDEIVRHPTFSGTRAVSIRARPEEI